MDVSDRWWMDVTFLCLLGVFVLCIVILTCIAYSMWKDSKERR